MKHLEVPYNKKVKPISYLLVFVSLILFYIAPKAYNSVICFAALFIFICNAYLLFKHDPSNNKYYLAFFIFSFFGCNFLYPCFVYPLDQYYFKIFSFISSFEYVIKAAALSSLGFSAFTAGYLSFNTQKADKKLDFKNIDYTVPNSVMLLLDAVLFILFILFSLTAGSAFYSGEFYAVSGPATYITILFRVLLFLITTLSFYSKKDVIKGKTFSFIKHIDLFALILGMIFIFLQVRTGERGVIIQYALLLFLLYNMFVTKVPKKLVLVGSIVGIAAMSFIVQTRSESNPLENNPFKTTDKSFILFDAGLDFVVNNLTVIEAFNYVDDKGFAYGKNVMGPIIQTVPFAQSVIYPIFNIDPMHVSSARLLTVYVFEETHNIEARMGLGTNMNADLYLIGGPMVLLIFMFLFGKFINKYAYEAIIRNDLISLVIFANMFILSIYSPRSSIFFPLQAVVWSYIIVKLVAKTRKKQIEEQ